MMAMVLKELCQIAVPAKAPRSNTLPLKAHPLELMDLPVPYLAPHEVLMKVQACGICRTELDQIEGRIALPRLPVIPGHQPVGTIAALGKEATRFRVGERVGAAWIFSACGQCKFCRSGQENLCDRFQATGCHANGGYAEYLAIGEDYVYRIPEDFNSAEAAPLMCGGTVGYRSLRLTGMMDGKSFGLYGFGSANHLVIQMANYLFPNSKKFVFSRNPTERELALKLGADWAGNIQDRAPEPIDCVIDTTPAWLPVVDALTNLSKGGRLVINAIRKEAGDKEALLNLDYARHLWQEKEIKTVANVTRRDTEEFLALAGKMRIRPEIQVYKLEKANQALVELKAGQIRGSKVLVMD